MTYTPKNLFYRGKPYPVKRETPTQYIVNPFGTDWRVRKSNGAVYGHPNSQLQIPVDADAESDLLKAYRLMVLTFSVQKKLDKVLGTKLVETRMKVYGLHTKMLPNITEERLTELEEALQKVEDILKACQEQ